ADSAHSALAAVFLSIGPWWILGALGGRRDDDLPRDRAANARAGGAHSPAKSGGPAARPDVRAEPGPVPGRLLAVQSLRPRLVTAWLLAYACSGSLQPLFCPGRGVAGWPGRGLAGDTANAAERTRALRRLAPPVVTRAGLRTWCAGARHALRGDERMARTELERCSRPNRRVVPQATTG